MQEGSEEPGGESLAGAPATLETAPRRGSHEPSDTRSRKSSSAAHKSAKGGPLLLLRSVPLALLLAVSEGGTHAFPARTTS